jgi:orotate phosphoribosyltransferase
MTGRVLVVDDVITAGTAIRESMQIIQQEGCTLGGVLIALDRQERGTGDLSAIQQIERDYSTRVVAICTLANVVEYLKQREGFTKELCSIEKYRLEYGI